MLDSVYEALRRKEMQYVFADPVPAKREVWLLVRKGDKTAKKYCERILQHPAVRAGVREAGSAQELENFLADLADRAYDSMNPLKNRQYFLYITSSLEDIIEPDFESFREEFTEFEYELIYLTRKTRTPGSYRGFMGRMIINPRDILSGQLLALDAAYTFPRFSPHNLGFLREYSWYRIQTRDFSALRDDIYSQIYSGLYVQLQGEGQEVIERKFRETDQYFKNYIDRICGDSRSFPMAWDLPLPGYGQLCGILENRFSRNRRGTGPIDTGMTVGEGLLCLFGNEQGICRTERLRRELSSGVLENVCRKEVQANREGLTSYLQQTFTLQDLCSASGIANLAGLWKYNYEKLAEEAQNMLIQSMQKRFYVLSPAPEDLFQGFSEYFALWDRFSTACMWKEWWEEIADLAAKTASQIMDEYQVLTEIFTDAESNIDLKQIQPGAQIQIRSVKGILNLIYGATGVRVFSVEDFSRLMDREARRIIDAKGDIADTERRPKMCLFVNKEFYQSEERTRNDLDWLIRPVPYVTKAMTYFTAVYAVPDEEPGGI